MRLIHCTAKLLKELKNPHLQNSDTPNPEGLGNWYANLLRIDRRKCILFTNEKTFYSFMITGVKKENLQNIFNEFLFHLNMNLQAEGFGIDAISKVMAEYTEMGLAKTSNRQVLGVMNDFACGYQYFIDHEGGLDRVRILEANRRTNRTPSSPLKYHFPIDMVWMLLTGEELEKARRSTERHLLKEEVSVPLPDSYCGDDKMEEHLIKAGSNLSIFGLYGLIFGCLAAPKPVMPSVLMPAIFGKEGAKLETERQAQEIIGSIMALWNRLNRWDPGTVEMPFPGFDYPLSESGAFHRILDALSLSQSFCSGLELGGIELDDLPGELSEDAEQLKRVTALLFAQAKLLESEKGQGKKELQKTMKSIENGETVIDGCIINIHVGLKDARLQFAGQIGADVMRKTPAASGAKAGRNEPCPCGSGKKYKKCCGLMH